MKDFTLVMEVERGGRRPPLLTKGPRSGPFVSQDGKDGYILTSIQSYFGVGKVYYETFPCGECAGDSGPLH